MYKIMNQSARSFIVRAEDVIKGGTKAQNTKEKIIPGGPNIVEVTDKLGKSLKGYAGILIVEIIEEEDPQKGKKK